MSAESADTASSLDDYLDLLAVLRDLGVEFVVIGGCAVGAWKSLSAQLGRFADGIIELRRNAAWLGLVKVMTSLTVLQPALAASTMAGVHDERDSLEAWLEAATADGRLR